MKRFTIYDMQTGTILRTGTCQDEAFELQVLAVTEDVIEGEGDAKTQRVDPVTRQFGDIA